MALAPETRVSQAVVRAVTQLPTDETRISQAVARTLVKEDIEVRVSQTVMRTVVRGRVEDPTVRAWTYTLDGHDYYVLHLGTIETLVYDKASGEWFTWGSGEAALWKAYFGGNWIDGRALGAQFGSDVVVGDDANGSLYFLAPDFTEDSAPQEGFSDIPFRREVTGQVLIPGGYDYVPCFGVQIWGSIGSNVGDVTLAISDDRGHSYEDVGTLSIDGSGYDFRLDWPSLGSMQAPGRLVRLTDYGALARVDGFQMERGDGE